MNKNASLSEVLFSFDGRIPRSTYWYYSLSVFGLSFVAVLIDMALGTYNADSGIGLLGIILALALIIPGLAIQIKRCHDRNHTGWFLLVSLIPFVGGLWLGIELGFLRGTEGPNQYGPDPAGYMMSRSRQPQPT